MITISQTPKEREIIHQFRRLFFPHGIFCPRCGRRYTYKIGNQYFCKVCRYKFTFKALLFCKGSKLNLRQLWIILQCFTQELSCEDAVVVSGHSYQTIHRWYTRFSNLIPLRQSKLSGIVEMDEAFIGKKKYSNQTIVLGALERKSGAIVLATTLDRETGSLDTFILKHIESQVAFFGLTRMVVTLM